ncbi:MAG: S-(hydroxymethyl)mycothiol dehydrogenase [Gemmatimonadota bacterium]|nr:MAG: S-(hydroxymethyl)mycothiol dehydrogenase [Gemmatimonadota bacterium]
MKVTGWVMTSPAAPMVLEERDERPGPGEVVVKVAGCGVCHTDLGFFYDGVPTRRELPLTLGHEVSGTVTGAGAGAESWQGRPVVVPAVIPCGKCDACRHGHGGICPRQIFPGNDVHGGFATHLRVPAHGLCPVPDLSDPAMNPRGLTLPHLSVIADAVSTPFQAVQRSGLASTDLAVFVGAGGIGGFGVQVAAARGARVVAIDQDASRLELVARHGADLTLNSADLDFRAIKQAVKSFAAEHGIPTWRTRIFEMSGSPGGQATAFGLVGHGGYLGVVGFTPAKLELRLSNLMAFDATAQGNWGCLPEHYPAIVSLVLAGKIALEPFVEFRDLTTINQTFSDIHERRTSRRVILVPEETT